MTGGVEVRAGHPKAKQVTFNTAATSLAGTTQAIAMRLPTWRRIARAAWKRLPPPFRNAAANPKLLAIAAAAGGQMVMLAAMALVSRRYPPSALTQYGVFFSLFGILQITAALRIEQGIVYEASGAPRHALYACAQTVVVPVSVLTGLIAAVYLAFNHVMAGELVWFLAPLMVAATASAMARTNVQAIAALDRFRILPAMNFLRPAAIGAFQIAGVLLTARSGVALCLCFAASQLAYAAITFGALGRVEFARASRSSMAAMREAFVRNRQFTLYSLPQNLLYALSEALVPLSLPFLFPQTASVAMFWLASRTVFAPATIVAESVRPMIYREIARAGPHLTRKCLVTAAMLVAPILASLLVLAVAGRPAFALVFGARWASANDYALILGALVAFNMAALPFVGALPILGMQRAILIAEIVGLAARAGAISLHRWVSPEAAVLWATVAYMAVMGAFLALVLRRMALRGVTAAGVGTISGEASAAAVSPPLQRIGLFGVPGHNRGDDAISLTVQDWLARHFPDARLTVATLATVTSSTKPRAPNDIVHFTIDRRSPFGLWRLVRAIAAQDVVLIGGGSLVQDKHGGGRWRGVLGYAWTVTAIARLLRKPMLGVCLGIDALESEGGRRAAREMLRRLAWIAVRDEASAANLRALLGANTDAVILPDPAFGFAPGVRAPADASPGAAASDRAATGGYFALAPAFEGHDEAHIATTFAGLVRALAEHYPGARFSLIAMDARADEDGGRLHRITDLLAGTGCIVDCVRPADATTAAGILRGSRGVIAMRLHALILAYGHVPVFCLSRTTKTEALMARYAIAGCDISAPTAQVIPQAMSAMESAPGHAEQVARHASTLREIGEAATMLAFSIRALLPRAARPHQREATHQRRCS